MNTSRGLFLYFLIVTLLSIGVFLIAPDWVAP